MGVPSASGAVAATGAAVWPLRRRLAGMLAVVLAAACAAAQAQVQVQPGPAEALRAAFGAAQARAGAALSDRPLYLQSTETAHTQTGDVHALVDHRFDTVRQHLGTGAQWCRVLILHLNVKYCRSTGEPGREVLDVGIGRKFDQPLADVHWLRFDFRVQGQGPQHLSFQLQAPSGPMSTRDYRIVLEATPWGERQTLVHLTYSYAFGTAARWAMQTYLHTLGSGKLGFTTISPRPGLPPVPVEGVRGLLERNTMRYYLAVEAHLGASELPPAQAMPQSLRAWFDATERYARQLHELDRDPYLDMKQRELRRQDSTTPPPLRRP